VAGQHGLVPVVAEGAALVVVDARGERLHHRSRLVAVAGDLGGEPVVLGEREGGDPAQGLLRLGGRRVRQGPPEVLEDRQLQVRGLAEEGEQVGSELREIHLRRRFRLRARAESWHLDTLARA